MLQFVHYRVEDAGYRTIQCIGYYVVVIYVIDDVLARAVWQTCHVYIRKVTIFLSLHERTAKLKPWRCTSI